MSLFTAFPGSRRSASPRFFRRKSRPYLETLESRTLLTCEPLLWYQHVDVEVEYKGGELEMRVHDNDNDQSCTPSETVLYVGPNQRTTQPAGWDFIGAGAGNTYWRLPQVRTDPNVLLLGGGAEEIDPAQFDAYRPADPRVTSRAEWIKVTLRELYAPGHISVWRDGQPPSQWWVSSYDGGRTYEPAFYMAAGGHIDFNWGFTAAGVYVVGFEASAFRGGSGLPLRSAIGYYIFYVDDVTGSPGGSAPEAVLGDPAVVRALAPAAPARTVVAAPSSDPAVTRPTDTARAAAVSQNEQKSTPISVGSEAVSRADPLFADALSRDTLFT